MSKNLVLVESPSKAKTINKYLGKNYKVEATVGHIRNLPKTTLGIDFENGFKPKLLNIRGKGDIIKKIKNLAAKSDNIFIATDPDREGEAIASDIIEIIQAKSKAKVYRVLFNEITKNAVNKAMKSPLQVNDDLVSSQRARRVMDRIIGYKISPYLWQAITESAGNSLSAGRVQSVALRLICEREERIENFIPTEYWSITAQFKNEKDEFLFAKLAEIDGKLIKIPPKPDMSLEEWDEFHEKNIAIVNKNSAEDIFNQIMSKNNFTISEVKKKEVRRNPFPPFITSSMQAEASRRLKMRPRETMRTAQSLYEGINLGKEEGYVGLITYMRTDSTRLGDEILDSASEFIRKNFGDNYKPPKPRVFISKKKKNIQDAHEAIRPTSVKYTPEFVRPHLNPQQFKLYELIWKRFLASQMEAAILETTTVSVKADEFLFKSAGTVIKFNGFLRVYGEAIEDSSGENGENLILPAGLEENQAMILQELSKNQHFTKPSARFTESTLIKELESNGIGRPSTYALVMGTIQDRNYVEQVQRKLVPTNLGKKVNSFLIEHFPKILNINFTAQMEDELDLIANGTLDYQQALNDFYTPFSESLIEVEGRIEKLKCEKCGSDMEIKIGRYGKFLACTNYPECRNIKSLKETKGDNGQKEFTGETCPQCGSKTIYRDGKFGKFIGCEKYPECNFTKRVTTGIKCPKCSEGDVITRRSKKGKFFYGCSRYPDCDFISWTKPSKEVIVENENVHNSESQV